STGGTGSGNSCCIAVPPRRQGRAAGTRITPMNLVLIAGAKPYRSLFLHRTKARQTGEDDMATLTHPQVWNAIDRLAARYGYSASGLAKKSGLDPTSFNKSKRVTPEGRPRWPSTESIAKILHATGASID